MKKIEEIIERRPQFHSRETEIRHPICSNESFLGDEAFAKVSRSDLTCYGIGPDVLRFIAENVGRKSVTLETGAGCSTLIFALKSCQHHCITPSLMETERITDFAAQNDIDLKYVEFIVEPSEVCLPRMSLHNLDLVLIDGKHAFPWPILDWFYTAERLKVGGIVILDDLKLRSVNVLREFMSVDPNWEFVHDFSGKSCAFRKRTENVFDVAWHMQPWTAAKPTSLTGTGLVARVLRKLFG